MYGGEFIRYTRCVAQCKIFWTGVNNDGELDRI